MTWPLGVEESPGCDFFAPWLCNSRQKYMENLEQNTNTRQRNANTNYDQFEGI